MPPCLLAVTNSHSAGEIFRQFLQEKLVGSLCFPENEKEKHILVLATKISANF